MATDYARLPYGTITPGISLSYGDTVPDTAVNLAYIETKVPPVTDVITVEDDLRNSQKYSGNYLVPNIRSLQVTSSQIIDPNTSAPWVAPTDNVFFTTVTSTFVDSQKTTTQIPLFYCERLRYPVSYSRLSSSFQEAASNLLSSFNNRLAIPYRMPTIAAELKSLVNITTGSGEALPVGYLWEVNVDSIINDDLYITVYTNFTGSYKQNFKVTWNKYTETLNTHAAYYQNLKQGNAYSYYAQPVIDNSTGTILQTYSTSASSTSTISLNPAVPSGTAPQTIPVSDSETVSIIATTTYSPASSNIISTTDNPYYISSPGGFNTYNGTSSFFSTPSNISAPQLASNSISLNLSNVNCTNDSYGVSSLGVNLYDPNNSLIQSYSPSSATQVLTYNNPNALAGSYTWEIFGIVDDSLGVSNHAPYATYRYTCTYSGSIGWYVPASTNYSTVNGTNSFFSTAATSVAPTTSATAVSLTISSLNVPSTTAGSTSYQVMLFDSSAGGNYIVSNALQTWNFTTNQTLSYYNSNALPGTHVFVVQALVSSTNTATQVFNTSLQGTLKWYVVLSATSQSYISNLGSPSLYSTNNYTTAPISINSKLELNLTTVTTNTNSIGSSSLTVTLLDPRGELVLTKSHIVSPVAITYFNINAVSGVYTWQINSVCSSNQTGVGSFTDTFQYIVTNYQANPSAPISSSQSRTLGFSFSLGINDGTIYSTYDSGAQIFLQEPDNIDVDSNWYLRLHRGWLSYTDTFLKTYLVGMQPYYNQNFNTVIPLVTLNQEKALITGRKTIRVAHTPIFMDPFTPIDVIVTRLTPSGKKDLWITRDNQNSSGVYQNDSIVDVDSARGTITLNDIILTSSDKVHVTYTYLEYYYVYQGFPDIFNRFISLDVNPSGGHSWFNLWNIANESNTPSYPGVSTAAVTSAYTPVPTPVRQSENAIVSSNSSITSSQSTTTTNNPFNTAVTGNLTTTIVPTTTDTVTAATTSFDGESTATSTPYSFTNTSPVIESASSSYSATNTVSRTAVTSSTNTPATQTKSITSSPIISNIPNSQTSRVTDTNFTSANPSYQMTSAEVHPSSSATKLQPLPVDPADPPQDPKPPAPPADTNTYYEHTLPAQNYYTYNCVAQLPPTDTSTQIQMIIPAGGTYSSANPGLGIEQQYPFNEYDNTTYLTDPSTPHQPVTHGPSINLTVELYDSNSNFLTSWVVADPTAAQTLSYSSSNALAGTYQYRVYFITSGGILSWKNTNPLGSPVFSWDFQYKMSTATNTTSSNFSVSSGSVSNITTDANTIAPTSSSTQLSLNVSNLVLPNTGNGNCYFAISLSNPSGQIVYTNTNVSGNTSITWSNPNAIAGAYTWGILATATVSNTSNAGTYNCSGTFITNWTTGVFTTTYNYAGELATAGFYSTAAATLAPTSSSNQLSLQFNNVVLPSDANGSTAFIAVLLDPNKNTCYSYAQVTLPPGNVLTYYSPNAISGSYTWVINVVSIANPNATNASSYFSSANITIDWYEQRTTTSYLYSYLPGQPYGASTASTTVAPTTSANQLSINFAAMNLSSDSNNSTKLQVSLNDPNGNQVASYLNVSTVQTINYYNASAIAGAYTWYITTILSNLNLTAPGVYTATFDGTLTYQNNVYTVSYTNVVSASNSTQTPSNTLAPTTASVPLTLVLTNVSTPSDIHGTTFIKVNLLNPSGNTVAGYPVYNTTAPITFTYYNSSAVAGAYTWVINAYATSNNNGADSYNVTYSGSVNWYQSVTTNSTVYKVVNGVSSTFTVPGAPNIGPLVSPSTTTSALIFNVTGLTFNPTTTGSAVPSFTVLITDSNNNTLQTYNNITSPRLLSYFATGQTGTSYKWVVYATASNNNTTTAAFTCTLNGSISWVVTQQVPTQVFSSVSGAIQTYQTSQFTIAPQTSLNEISGYFPQILFPKNAGSNLYLLVSLLNPQGVILETTEIHAGDTPIIQPYFNTAAIAGSYFVTVQAKYDIGTTNVVGSYPINYDFQFNYQSATNNIMPTANLVDKSLFMYLTVEGYPFHAVLDETNDPITPLQYDTNNAIVGTRYSSIPTIHAFTGT